MAIQKQSLNEFYPRRYDVLAAILGALTLLVLGLSLPIVTVQKKILWTTAQNTYSVMGGIADLAANGDYVLAIVVFFFSMIFPFVKLLTLWLIWRVRLYDAQRRNVLQWLGSLGKWSMLDVFAVAILVVLAKLRTLTEVQPQIGIYFFGSAIIASMLTTVLVEHLVKEHR